MGAKSGKMFWSWIAFVFGKVVFGIHAVEAIHLVVARDFCDDARRSDTQARSVSPDDGRLCDREIGNWKSVDQDMGGADSKAE
jgi:hypothetical protein